MSQAGFLTAALCLLVAQRLLGPAEGRALRGPLLSAPVVPAWGEGGEGGREGEGFVTRPPRKVVNLVLSASYGPAVLSRTSPLWFLNFWGL